MGYNEFILIVNAASVIILLVMPLLWLLVQRGFNPYYRFTPLRLLHFLPAVLSLILFCASVFSLPQSRYYDFMIHENTGDDTWLGDVNYTIVLLQLIGYFYTIFRYLHKVKHFARSHYSAAELQRKVWIPRFIGLFAAMFVVGFCRKGTHQLQQGELGTGLGHPAYGIRHSPAGRNPVVRVVYT